MKRTSLHLYVRYSFFIHLVLRQFYQAFPKVFGNVFSDDLLRYFEVPLEIGLGIFRKHVDAVVFESFDRGFELPEFHFVFGNMWVCNIEEYLLKA